jgi:NADPH:quinone reductase-like Zn-dependent oxidoreductase
MSSVSFPLTYRALGNEDLTASLLVVHKTIDSLGADEVLIRVTHSSINFMDPMLQRRNIFQLPLPMVLGFDFAGEVAALGSGDNGDLTVGAKVMGGAARGGGYGEYVVVPKTHVALRKEVPSAQASTFGVAFGTAYEGVEMEMNIAEHKGKTILIPGAAGGCGHFAAQLAKRAGLKVIGTTSKPAGVALLKELGVDHVIDYGKQDVAKEVMAITGGKGADLVWDSTYLRSSLEQSAALVAKGGLWCLLGTAQQRRMGGITDYDGLLQIARDRGATATFSDYARWHVPGTPQSESRPDIRREVMRIGMQYWQEGSVKPRVTKEVPFDATALQQTFDTWKDCNVGKIVVKVAP